MGDTANDPVDHYRTTRPRAGEAMKDTVRMPGLILIGVGIAAVMVCLGTFAAGQAGWGVAAAIVALLAIGAGLAWIGAERRRVRAAEAPPPGGGEPGR
ncbi:hypothetical protein [Mycobacterium talmoniae]|uniref:UsfY protein n=1 Tax=Mycobacterium talmoniae TaxID=1858794 RepID=A0A1S1MZ80_9MYCO|nr:MULTISPECIES: hypothetical protein [Mycobacterium]OHU94243.1 hypothetical protein BKN37_23665 [Mycobacterium talmoniae]TDH51248.1 LapA family protein [Mycobacterium eburneum]